MVTMEIIIEQTDSVTESESYRVSNTEKEAEKKMSRRERKLWGVK